MGQMREISKVLERLSNIGDRGYSKKTESILYEILNTFKESDECSEKDGMLIYEVFLNSLKSVVRGSSKYSGSNAERVLRKMEEYSSVIQTIPKPNVQIYTLVIDAYAQSYSKNGAYKAENLMNEMIQLSDSGVTNILPDNNTLKNVIKAWVQSGAPEAATKANSILVTMEKCFLEGNENLKPDEE